MMVTCLDPRLFLFVLKYLHIDQVLAVGNSKLSSVKKESHQDIPNKYTRFEVSWAFLTRHEQYL